MIHNMIQSNDELIQELSHLGYLNTERIVRAFSYIDRKDFVPPQVRSLAYRNEPLPIGEGQTISQPLVVAFMLELLDVRSGERVLEIGVGSGWQTALLAFLARGDNEAHPAVVGIERIASIADQARSHLAKLGFLESGLVELVVGDGSRGYETYVPYEKIICAASAREIPDAWKEQLAIGGRIVAPVRNSIVVLDKKDKKEFEQKEFYGFSFVPLVEGDTKREN